MNQQVVRSSVEATVDLGSKRPMRVLHVDDEISLLKIAKQCLEMEGRFKVDTASSVREAMEKASRESYDAIVSDYQMPEKDGLEFLKELRQNGNNIPFILFTCKGREEVVIKALNMGADYYVSKSGDSESVYTELAHSIRETVESRNVLEMLKESEEKYKSLVENSRDSIVIIDLKGNVLFANKATERLTGYTDRMTRVNVRQITPLKYWPKSLTMLLKARKGEQIPYFESIIRRKDGSLVPVETVGQAILRDGRVMGVQIITRDISDRKEREQERRKTEEELRQNEEKFRTLFNEAMDAIFVADAETGILVDCNQAATELVGRAKSELIGKHQRILHPETETEDERFSKTFQQHIGEREGQVLETQIITKNGEIKEVAIKGNIIELRDRRVLQGIFRDLSKQKKAEESLRNCSQRYEKLFESDEVGVIISDPEGKISSANPTAARMLGYSGPKELVGLTFLESYVDQNQRKMLLEQLREKGYVQGEAVLKRKDNTQLCVEASTTLYKDAKGNVLRTESAFTEASGREKAEEELRESEGRFRSLFESIQDPVGIFVGREGHLVDYNTAFKRSSGYTDEELKGKAFLDFVHSDDRAMVLEKYRIEYSEEKLPLVYEIRGLNKKGESIPLELSVSTYKKKGRAVGIEVIHRDITERKRYEQSLSALNTYGRKLNTAKSMEEIYELTLDAAEKTLGFEFADIFRVEGKILRLVTHRGKTKISSLSLPMDEDRGISVRAARTGNPILVPDISKEEAYVEGEEGGRSEFAVPIKIGSKVLGVLNVESKELDAFKERDQELLEILASHAATAISNLDRASELEAYAREIRESKHRFEGLFLGNPEATICLAPDFSILDINPRFRELFGYSLSEIKGKHIDEAVVPRDKVNEAEILNKKAVEGYVYHDTLRITKNGSLIPVSISAAPIRVEGKLIGYIGVYKDISDLKETERKLESTNEKLRVVGGLTRHDTRNKLSTITGNTYLLKKQLAGNKEDLDKLVDIETAVQQIAKIFDFARTYEMLGAEDHVYVDVEKTVNEAISLFPSLDNIKIVNDCHGLTVLADSLLRQLFYNLIDNSLKYGQRATKIRAYYERTGQDELRLVYEDDGAGIPSAEKPRLFKEGYSTGGSTGYGLYLIKKMIEVYGWSIQETGEPDKGARFTMAIPRMNTNGKENYRID